MASRSRGPLAVVVDIKNRHWLDEFKLELDENGGFKMSQIDDEKEERMKTTKIENNFQDDFIRWEEDIKLWKSQIKIRKDKILDHTEEVKQFKERIETTERKISMVRELLAKGKEE